MKNFGFLPEEVTFGYPVRVVLSDDAHIIDSLLKCVISWPTIFGLVWGDQKHILGAMPDEYKKIVSDILLIMSKKEECQDPLEKKLYSIILGLLQVLHEKQVNDYVEAAKKAPRVHR